MKTNTYVLLAASILLVLTAISLVTYQAPQVTLIQPSEYEAVAASAVVIDVYKPGQQPLSNTDYQIPYDDLEALQAAIPTKNTPVLLYCKGGVTSAQASKQLLEAGYSEVYELAGGTRAYREQTVAASSCQAR